MNSDTVVQLLQKGFRVTLGATASLVEILQDPQKREANLAKLRTELDQLAQEWAEKGEVTEREARSYVDTFLAQRRAGTVDSPTTVTTTATTITSESTSSSTPSPEVQLELQELTAQLSAIRAELEKMRNQDGK
jgi:polyhydroxyalkanoate synthesis regulator phasin